MQGDHFWLPKLVIGGPILAANRFSLQSTDVEHHSKEVDLNRASYKALSIYQNISKLLGVDSGQQATQ